LFALNICGEKVCIILAFYKTYKPAIYILPVHSSGSGFSIKFSIFRGGKMDGVFDGMNISRSKVEVVSI
jgi:hypothetical protein